ncbi:flagellar basal body-associated protein FliL [Bradyrhizobium sp. G127]|uniref:flagellar basal body-associated protein FliL n=1 Tax=Bradyrhizobium sp. G127 TaxID=2904800 RepID=UPI001F217E29|nr:flagellar basal body-associated protein FliL [Bradyrhizobium sp. G127]MCF2524370.1 flagellar basal body-associated protein FliL [Bradyrhizobium sp. G127]
MADEDQVEEGAAEAAAPKGKRKLVIIGGALVLVLTLGGGGWFFFMRGHGEEKQAVAPPPKPPVFLDVPEVLVNLANTPGERVQYLKVRIVLEVKDQPLVAQIQPTMPRVMDLFQTYMRELRPGDLNGSIGLFRLKEELTRRVNAAISPNQVNAVLFKEIIIQ